MAKRIFYSNEKKHEIVDLTASKEAPSADYEVIDIEDDEVAYFDGALKKKKSDDSDEVKTEKKNTRKADKQFAREKMNLTKPEMKRFAAGLKAYIEDNGED